ncbi:unnamed protein product [Mytilus coruscus]|uniref:Ig-like domain-containing protein n=1 Tax=Mytilus coruscus TaxID=42192 RepID=A0A6J8A4I9_MYTCO|nr:unnamed protein product [Mytilus coruscus]
MSKIELKIMNATCEGNSCNNSTRFKICYADQGGVLNAKCLELYDTFPINDKPINYQRFDTVMKPFWGIGLTVLPFTFIIYINDEPLYDSTDRPQNGTTMVLTFKSDTRSFIQIGLTSECFDVQNCTGFLCHCYTKPPTVTVPHSKAGAIGGNLTIPCNVSELYSGTTIKWFKNGFNTTINIRENERFFGGTNKSPDLTIISAQKEDEGNYTCRAKNLELEGSSQPVYLSIFEYPVVNVSNIEPVIEGTNVTIPCYVTPSSGVTYIAWDKNNSTLDIYGNDRFGGGTISSPSLEIYFVEENDDGNYTCQAKNPVGIRKSGPTHLQVLPDIPKVHLLGIEPVVIGSNVTIQCYISSVSTLKSVTWLNNNVTINTSNASNVVNIFSNESMMSASLTIYSVEKEHEGTLICHANNTAGNWGFSKPVQLIVLEDIPKVFISRIEAVNIGEHVTLSCNISSVSKLKKIVWYKDNIDFNLNTSHTKDDDRLSGGTLQSPSLTIYSVQQKDEGNYTCKATNTAEKTGWSNPASYSF